MSVGSAFSLAVLTLACYACDATAANSRLISPKPRASTHALSLIARPDYRNDTPDFDKIVKLIRGMRADALLRHAGPRLEVVLGERESTCTNRAAYVSSLQTPTAYAYRVVLCSNPFEFLCQMVTQVAR